MLFRSLYRTVFATANEQTFLVDGTSRAGIEAAMVSLLEPGDRVLVPVFGRFGHLLTEIASRCGAEVHTVEVPWGEVVPAELVEEAVVRVRPKLIATVHGDTSTTMCQPIAAFGEIARRHDVLLYCDTTASLGGNLFETDAWGVDVVTAGLQKCLGGPSGSAPITIAPRAVEVIEARKHVEAGIADAPMTSWQGLAGPGGLPEPMVRRINTEIVRLFNEPEFGKFLVSQGLDNLVGTPEAFAAFMRKDRRSEEHTSELQSH